MSLNLNASIRESIAYAESVSAYNYNSYVCVCLCTVVNTVTSESASTDLHAAKGVHLFVANSDPKHTVCQMAY